MRLRLKLALQFSCLPQ